MASNFDFLRVDIETAELFSTINMAENNYTQQDYEGVLTKFVKLLRIQQSYLLIVYSLNYHYILLFIGRYKLSNLILKIRQ